MIFLRLLTFEDCNRLPLFCYNMMIDHGSTENEIQFNKPPIGACPCLRKCAGDKNEA
jgi:hypothetical protein